MKDLRYSETRLKEIRIIAISRFMTTTKTLLFRLAKAVPFFSDNRNFRIYAMTKKLPLTGIDCMTFDIPILPLYFIVTNSESDKIGKYC